MSMTCKSKLKLPPRYLTMCYVVWITLIASVAYSQTDDAQPEKKPVPVTTADPGIGVEYLRLLVKPLTVEELIVETDAWRDLLKANAQEIADLQIAVKKNEATADPLPQLLDTKTSLIKKLDVTLDELEAKGGEGEPYRQYVSSLSGVSVDGIDASTAVKVFRNWLTSEQGGSRWAWNIGKFLIILVVFYFGAGIVSQLLKRAMLRVKGQSHLLAGFMTKFVKQLLMIIGFIVALAALEIDITPLLAAIGAAGFVVGFALKDTLGNFASGLLILAYRPFDVGDSIDAAGVSGKVDSVSLFSTHVRTFDNKLMIVPNNDIWGGTITNSTASETRRVDMVFGIGYDDDTDKARDILESLLKEHELVLEDPAPVIRLHELADSSVNFVCRPWTKTSDYWTVYWDITQSVKKSFDRNEISIPFPQRDIHLYQESLASSGIPGNDNNG